VTLADDKQSYSWQGNGSGEGHMAIAETAPNDLITHINFVIK